MDSGCLESRPFTSNFLTLYPSGGAIQDPGPGAGLQVVQLHAALVAENAPLLDFQEVP